MKKLRVRFFLFTALLLSLVLIAGSAGAAPKDGAVVSLSAGQSEFGAEEDVLLTVTISNPTRHSVRILKWFTPSGGLEEPVFDVKVNGEPAAYTGAIYKRPPATGNDYLTLKAGQSLSFIVNLGEYYDLSQSGDYEIYYTAASYFLYSEKGNNSFNADYLSSEAISLKVDGRNPKKPAPPTPPPPGSTAFLSCDATKQAILLAARSNATGYSNESWNYLMSTNDTLRYARWFGTYTSDRDSLVTDHFSKIYSAFANEGLTFNCACKQPYYAYVYPTEPYTIYVCKVFWTAPATGTDSQAGTLVHEMSHFNVVASTDDFVYGTAGALDLALTAPDDAVMNADNHEYFAENTPATP